MNSLLLAWRYLSFHRGRTLTLVASIALIAFLPLASRWVLSQFEARAMQRAKSTPLVIGTKGSRFAIALHALYFRGESPEPLKYAEIGRLEQYKFAKLIPIHCRFRGSGFPIVGTTSDYFDYRGLTLAEGPGISGLGECLLGAKVATQLGLRTGDKLMSESENLFELSGSTPLRLRVAGVLQTTGTADDEAIFCLLQTAWIMEGLGHGHSVLNTNTDDLADQAEHVHPASQQNLDQYQEVTPENSKSFHFHGRRSDYPITAILALPESEKAATLLQGKYLEPDQAGQIIRPSEVINELLQTIGRVRQLLELGLASLVFAAFLLFYLVLSLSVKLRKPEIRTMFLLGAKRYKIVQIVLVELILVALTGLAVALLAAWLTAQATDQLILPLL